MEIQYISFNFLFGGVFVYVFFNYGRVQSFVLLNIRVILGQKDIFIFNILRRMWKVVVLEFALLDMWNSFLLEMQ